jgi:hypothetical protein
LASSALKQLSLLRRFSTRPTWLKMESLDPAIIKSTSAQSTNHGTPNRQTR